MLKTILDKIFANPVLDEVERKVYGMTEKDFQEVLDNILAKVGGFKRVSLAGVSHLVTPINPKGSIPNASICYFRKKKIWRVFYPYTNSGQQMKKTLYTPEQVEKFIKTLREKK